MGGFKSWRSTPEQRAEWLAKNGGGDQPPADAGTNTGDNKDGTIDPKTLQEGPGTDNGNKPATDNPGTDKPVVDSTTTPPAQDLLHDFPSEAAKTQILTELNQTPAEDPAQQRVVSQADLIVANDTALKCEKSGANGAEKCATDTTAASLIQGISIMIEGEAAARTLSLDAVVKIGADIRTLHVMQAPLKVTSDGQTVTLPIVLKTVDTVQEVPAGDKVYVLGVCKDTACNAVQVRVEFTLDNGNKSAAVFLVQLTGEGYLITHSNIGELKGKDFATVFAAVGGKAAPVETQTDKPATDKPATDGAVTGGDQPVVTAPVLEDTRAEAIREHREAMAAAAAAKPATDVANVGGVVNGTFIPKEDPRITALEKAGATNKPNGPGLTAKPAATTALVDTRAEAIREHRESMAAATAKLPVQPAAVVQPPAKKLSPIDEQRQEQRLIREELARKKAEAAAAAKPAVTDDRQQAILDNREARTAAAKYKAERDLAIRNGVLAQWEAQQAQKRRYEAQLKAKAYRGATAK
jgi:hypothetical protein